MSPSEKIIRHVLVDEFVLKEEFDDTSAEALGHLREVGERDVDEIAALIEAALQNDGVPVGIEPQKFTEGLKAKKCSCFYRSFRCFVEIPLDHVKDELAHLGEELSVVTEKHS